MLLPSPEFGTGTAVKKPGRIDFFFSALKWGFELLRDGEHASRFDQDGAYGAWVETAEMEDYLILDFRVDKPVCAHPGMYSWSILIRFNANIICIDILKLYHV